MGFTAIGKEPSGQVYQAPPLSKEEMTTTAEDFEVPEFKKGTELYGVGAEDVTNAMGAPTTKGFTPIGEPTQSKGLTLAPASRGFKPLVPKDVANEADNWIPSWKQFKEEGFIGRIGVGIAERVGLVDKVEKVTTPEMTLKESLQAIGTEFKEHPLRVVKGLVRGTIEDPELLWPPLWEAYPVKIAASLAKAGMAAQVGTTAVRAGLIGGGIETAAQVAETAPMNADKIAMMSGMFGLLGGAGKAAVEGFKKIPTKVATPKDLPAYVPEGLTVIEGPTGKTRPDGSYVPAVHVRNEDLTTKHILFDREAIEASFADKPWTKPKVEGVEPLPENAFNTPKEYADFVLAHEEAHTRVMRPKGEDGGLDITKAAHENVVNEMALATIKEFRDSPVLSQMAQAESIMKSFLRNTLADNHLVDVIKRNIDESIPDKNTRERMTMAAEAEKKTDILMTDKEKFETLNGTGKIDPVTGYKDSGMKGALEGMAKRLDKLPPSEQLAFKTKMDSLDYVIQHLEHLPSEEHAIPILKTIKEKINAIGLQAKSLNMMDGLRNNYIPHMLNWKEFTGTPVQRQAILDALYKTTQEPTFTRDFTQHRVYDTIRNLEKHLREMGAKGVKVEKDISKVYEAYSKSMLKSITERKMVDHFLGEKQDIVDGTRVLTRNIEEGLKQGYVPFQGYGSKALEGVLVHPDFVDLFKFAFRQQDSNGFIKAISAITMLTKSMQTVGSLFHAKSLLEAITIFDPKGGIKEIATGFSGIRAATNAFIKGDASNKFRISEWMRNGLVLGTEDIDLSIIGKTGQFVDAQLSRLTPEGKQVKALQYLTGPMDKFIIQPLNKVTWDYMHTGGKIHIANAKFARMKAQHPEMPDATIMKEVASVVNNTLGGLDWLEVASNTHHNFAKAASMKAMGLQGRELSQIAVFAPDWTMSTIRSMSEALPRELLKVTKWDVKGGVKGFISPKTRQDLARRYVFNTAVSYLTVMNGMNYALSGHSIFENKDPYKLEVGDGTKIQMAKHSMEVPEMIHTHGVSLGGKLGFFPKAVSVGLIGRTNPFSPRTAIRKDSPAARAREIALSVAPFPASGAVAAPTGEGTKRAVMSMLGAPIMGQTDAKHSDKDIRKERAKERALTRRTNAKAKAEERRNQNGS